MNQSSESNAAQPQVLMTAQYIKDLSFEAPNTPGIFTNLKAAPKIDLSLDVQAQKIDDSNYEVILQISTKATNEEEVLFITELKFAGLFSITNCTNEEQKEQILLIYCPSLIFPFARRIIADATRDGGFQPLMINPVDFASLYLQQKNKTVN